MRYPRSDRESRDHLRNMRIRTNDGRELPRYTVADIKFADGITRILRRERQRAVVVSAEVTSDPARPQHYHCDDRASGIYPAVAGIVVGVLLLPVSMALDPK